MLIELAKSQSRPEKVVSPAKAGVQLTCNFLKTLDSGLRRNDEKIKF